MSADLETLLEKIKTLPAQRPAEVKDFVGFLNARECSGAAERLRQVFDKLDTLNEPASTSKEVQAEIRAARAERRAALGRSERMP